MRHFALPCMLFRFGATTPIANAPFTSSLCIALSRSSGADTHGAAVAARNAVKGLLSNPMPWSIVLGVPLDPFAPTVIVLAAALPSA